MSSIIRIKKTSNYVVLDKGFINNTELSWKAKGILVFMLSKPDDWTFYINDLMKYATDGKASFRAGFNELKDKGYVHRIRKRDTEGKIYWETVVYEKPHTENQQMEPHTDLPQVENPSTDNPSMDNRTLLSNDGLNNDLTNYDNTNNDYYRHEVEKDKSSSSNAHSFYEDNIGQLNPFVIDHLSNWVNDLNEDLVIEAMKIALKNNKRFNYAEGILKDWLNSNVRTLEDVKAKEKQFKRKSNQTKQQKFIPMEDRYVEGRDAF